MGIKRLSHRTKQLLNSDMEMWLNEAPSLADGATRFQRADVCLLKIWRKKNKQMFILTSPSFSFQS